MKNYFSDKNALPIPWVESPFFYSLLKNSNLSEEEKEQCISYHENGYLIIDLELYIIDLFTLVAVLIVSMYIYVLI